MQVIGLVQLKSYLQNHNMLPDKYKWIEDIGTLPKLVAAGLQFLGIKEYAGTKDNNPVIMNMAKELGVSNIYTSDEVAWCGLFMCYLCHITGKPQPFKSYDILRAKSFTKWGNEVKKPEFGDILVFSRPEGSHVGLYISETSTTYVVLGGNQSNSVSFTEIAKSRLIASRRYYATNPPASVKQYLVNSTGIVSTNEA